MRKHVLGMLGQIESNNLNFIVYYEGMKKVTRPFSAFSQDIDACIAKLESLKPGPKRIGLIGPISYQWMVLDFACIKAGFYSIAYPETLSADKLGQLVADTKPDLILIDESLKTIGEGFTNSYYFNCKNPSTLPNFDKLTAPSFKADKEAVLLYYGTAFSSGTSENIKHISLKLRDRKAPGKGLKAKLKLVKDLIDYKLSFWSKKDNKVIIFMPFSHIQQRTFVLMALIRGINIVLSNPKECIKHLIMEKPNIMVSVPLIYEALAKRIDEKIKAFDEAKKKSHQRYLKFGVNTFSNNNPIKKYWEKKLFKDIRKIYGGNSDYFVTGSAPIDVKTLTVFYQVGVKIYEGYGQSESAFIALNSPKNFKIGSVGKPQVEIKISETSEILVKYIEKDYEQNKDSLVIKDGYIHTGDLGYLDKDGFLFLKGRIDEVIVLPNGKKVFPATLEQSLKQNDFITHALVFENKDAKLNAIIYSEKIKSGNRDSLISKLNAAINLLNKGLADYEKLSGFILVDEPFTVENQMLTSTFKLRRKKIKEKYASGKTIALNP